MTSKTSWRALGRRWPIVLVFVLLGLGVGAVLVSGTTPRYDASAEVLVQAPAQSDVSVPARTVGSYAHVLGGRTMAGRATEALGLAAVPDADVRASVVPGTTVLRVTARDDDPQRAEELADRTAQEFVDWLAEDQEDADEDQVVGASVITPGVVQSSAVVPDERLTYGLAALVGLLVGLLVARWRQLADRGVASADALREDIGVPVIGAIAHDRSALQQPLITSLGSHHPRAEAIRILRTNLQFLDVDRDRKVVTVTSSVQGEGKTTTACNLAISLAQSGLEVALVEGDLRRPQVAGCFGLEQKVGLTTTLVGRVPLEEAMQPTETPGLDVLAAGALPPNPAEIIQTAAMERTLAELRRRYEVVIIDAPPLLPVTDGALLSVLADGAILVVRHGRTGHDQVRAATERLEAVGARLLGAVVSMSPRREAARYGYGYGYEPEAEKRKGRGRRS